MFGKNNKKILIVEDDLMLLRILSEQLNKENFKVREVVNGLDVMEEVKDFKPDLILLDLVLPGLDGFSVLKNLKEDDSTSKIPVVVLSNLSDEEDVKSTMALGAEDHILKVTTKLEDVVKKIKKHL